MRWQTIMRMLAPVALIPAAAIAEEPTKPVAVVQGTRLSHPVERLTIEVPVAAVYAGGDRFNLYGVADAEVHVFVEADDQMRVQRVYWIQFESYLPSKPELSYDYAEGNRRTALWGTTIWLRAGPVATTGPMRPGSDREHVFAILERGGYRIPAEVMNVRLVQLLDDPEGTGKGRRELMLIYSEDLALSGKNLAELTTDGKPDADWTPLEQPLIQRATEALAVSRQ